MSTSRPAEIRTEDRTPAPAGSMSRILEESEAARIGLAPWAIEEFDREPLITAAPLMVEASAVDATQQQIVELQNAHRYELEEAVHRTRTECEARAQARIQHEIEPWLKRMAQSIEDLATVKQRYRLESEEQLVRLAVAIARRILHREIQVDCEALLGLIHAAMQRLEVRELNRVLLNPKDHAALQPFLERLGLPPRVEIVSDAGLDRGALLLESTTGILDASIQAQLDEVERGFVDLMGRRT
ncbi:FliH/SctL family protein [Bryobacter aggregatus]|uniref:FliH/SctL family protein n=1 Tax=Bryobacter aggregatus TaxID=360054 RepID=UPI0004E20D1B|nr:FliH/SctL family protein [Bryobacter aggregatus]